MEKKTSHCAHTPEENMEVDRRERWHSPEGLKTVYEDGAFMGRAGLQGKAEAGGRQWQQSKATMENSGQDSYDLLLSI